MAAGKVNTVVLPGDIICKIQDIESSSDSRYKLKLGPGLRQEDDEILAFKAGVLRSRDPQIFWVDTNQKRYVPVKDDSVIGIITNRGSESYKVDIGSSMPAALGNLSFEGATRRNRPNLQIGDLVYAKLSVANKDMEPELTCVDVSTNKSNGLGQLSGGFMFQVSIGLARKLLRPDYKILQLLGKHFPFEVTVGLNGRIWINSKGIMNTIAVANGVSCSEYMTDSQMHGMVGDLIRSLQTF